jgi:hypothetical protein
MTTTSQKVTNTIRLATAGEGWHGTMPPDWQQTIVEALTSGTVNGARTTDVVLAELGYFASTMAGDDPLDFVEGPAGVNTIRQADGILLLLSRPPKAWQRLRLLNGFKAAQREPASVPLVIMVARPRPWPASFEQEILDVFAWPLSSAVYLDVTTSEGLATACACMLELIARARATGAPVG